MYRRTYVVAIARVALLFLQHKINAELLPTQHQQVFSKLKHELLD